MRFCSISAAPVEAETGSATGSAEPALSADDVKKGGVDYRKPAGTLSVDGIGADDAVQGQVGDCYFISSMTAVANTHPEILQKAIHDNGNCTYNLTLWQHDQMDAAPRQVKVTVDGSVPEK
mgnify:CR=1 FL=1